MENDSVTKRYLLPKKDLARELLTVCRIERAANGFIVVPEPSPQGNGYALPEPADMHVFETFDALSDWLRQRFAPV